MVTADRTGPVISVDEPFADGYENRTVLNGYAYDDSGLAELEINGKKFPLDGSRVFQIQKPVFLDPGKKELVIKVKDRAENVTSARLTVSDRADMRKNSVLLAENTYFPGNVMADMPEKNDLPNDRTRPVIELRHLEEEQITYLDKAFIEGYICDKEQYRSA
ncbi:MAG: hypothetical protein GY795_23710 [Desulfobacterales bacterium]|nr:hypothetical protein [Desulfobacterales bacterium]